VSGEGGGVLLLQPLSAALRDGRRIRAVLRGSAVNQDGRSNGLTAPSRPAQAALIRQALDDALIRPDEVQYVEAHGSGTGLGDAIELSALHDVFGGRSAEQPLHVGAVKTNIGHTQSAAGVAGLIKTVLALEHGVIPTNLGMLDPSEAIPADGTIAPATGGARFTSEGERPVAGVSGFGISGTNAHIILQAAPYLADQGEVTTAGPFVLPLSASTAVALRAQSARLAEWLTGHPDADLADVAHTLSTGRAEFDHRQAIVCTDPGDALRQLTSAAGSYADPDRTPRIAVLLPGSEHALVDRLAEHGVRPDVLIETDSLDTPARFADAIEQGLDQGVGVFLDAGPGPSLETDRAQIIVIGENANWLRGLAKLWELGAPVRWPSVPGRLIALPSYPFQRQRFWPEVLKSVPEQPSAASPLVPAQSRPVTASAAPAAFTYAATWRRDLARQHAGDLALPGPLVIFTDQDGVGSELAERAAAQGTPVLEVIPGGSGDIRRDGRRVLIDSTRPEHYRELFAALPADGPLHLVHLWSHQPATIGTGFATDDELRTALHQGYDTLLLTAQAIGALLGDRQVRLLTVSRGAAEIIGADLRMPHRSVVHGLGRALHHEYPSLSWHGVDLDPEAFDPAQAADQLAHELSLSSGSAGSAGSAGSTSPTSAAVVGWRHGRRWWSEWTELPSTDDAQPVWRPEGVYLITGGSRGLGRALARHLVAAGVRWLMLVSRNASRHDVSELTDTGAEILVHDADVADPQQLRAALRRCAEHFGALDGVLHAAGVPASGMAQRQTVAGANAVIAPKMLAMGPLAELVQSDTPPELLVLYSSVVTAFGGIGEGDYCAANTVLDAYGAALSARASATRVATVAWGPWQHDDWGGSEGGSVLSEVTRQNRRQHGFTDELGCAVLERVLRGEHGSVVAVGQPLAEIEGAFAGMLDLDSLVTASPAPSTRQRSPRPPLRSAYVAPKTPVQKVICEVWEAFLGLDQVGVHDPFFDLGGNSLVGLAMVRKLEQELLRTIAPAMLFEHPTVAEFASVLERSEADDVVVSQLLNASTDRGQRRRRARTDAGK
jgi:acyl transferase domain-containing protein